MRAVALVAILEAGCVSRAEPEEQSVASRRQLAAGRFSDLDLDGSRDEGATVVALADPDPSGGTLTLFPFYGGEPCSFGRAVTHGTFGVHYDGGARVEDRPIRVSLFESLDDGRGPFRYVDRSCTVREPVLADDVVAPVLFDFGGRNGFFALTAGGDVHLLEPWDERSTLVASGVTDLEVALAPGTGGFTQLWLMEAGRIVVRSRTGEELARMGSSPTELAVGWNGGGAAFIDEGDLWFVPTIEDPAELLAEDACEPQVQEGLGLGPPAVVALSPCGDRRLVIVDLETREPLELDAGVGAVRRLRDWYFYVLGDSADTSVGPLFAVAPDGEAAPVTEGNQAGDLASVLWLGADFFLVNIDHDGTKGRLGTWSPVTGFSEVARGVAEFTINGTLAVLRDFDGETGTLDLLDPWARGVTLTAARVPRGGFRFSQVVWAIDYLEELDPETSTGRLRTFLIDDEVGFTIDEGVSEFREIQWPDAGMLYTIGAGDRQGLWFADWVD